MSAADRLEWEQYVQRQLAAFHEHTGGTGCTFKHPDELPPRMRNKGLTDYDAWRGPWRTVRQYVTGEFRQWVEEHFRERLTFSEWQAARIQERRDVATRERAYVDSSGYCLDFLEQWRELNRERDEWICEARERGASFADLMSATGMSRMALHNVIQRARVESAAAAVVAEAESITADAVEHRMIAGELVEVF